jgi:hypothetical protein
MRVAMLTILCVGDERAFECRSLKVWVEVRDVILTVIFNMTNVNILLRLFHNSRHSLLPFQKHPI